MTLFDPEPQQPTEARRLSLVRLTSELARSLAGVGRIAVEGEVHRPATRPGGRVYFVLKDRAAQLTVTVPANRARKARAVDGERVQVTGRLEWLAARGQAQLVAEEVLPVGAGAVSAMIAETRARLAADGLLARPRRPVPALPRAIGVVCGTDAAVRHDIQSVVDDRFPGYPLVFREVNVGGGGAAGAIAFAIADLERSDQVDVIVLARGGGDATQLLPFSDEDVCRAVCDSSVPVVSAIGHERDRPLCDEVADVRCGTPSLAAALVVPDRDALGRRLDEARVRAAGLAERHVERARRRVAAVDRDRAVLAGFDRARHRVDTLAARLAGLSPRAALDSRSAVLAGHRRHLEALSPQRVLDRGYAIVRDAGGDVVRDPQAVPSGSRLVVQVAGGRFDAERVDG